MMLRWGQQFNSNGFDLDQRRMIFGIRWVNVKQIKEKIKEEDENIRYKSNPSVKGEEGEVDEDQIIFLIKITWFYKNITILWNYKVDYIHFMKCILRLIKQ